MSSLPHLIYVDLAAPYDSVNSLSKACPPTPAIARGQAGKEEMTPYECQLY